MRWLVPLIVLVVLVAIGVVLVMSRGATPDASTAATPADERASSPAPSPIAEPRGANARASISTITLTWRTGTAADGDVMRITRDGSQLADVPVGTGRYLDEGVDPGASYVYRLQVRADGGRASDHVEVRVEVPTPPITAARLADVFDVRFELRASSGFSGLEDRSTGAWRFKPSCKEGPCDVVLSDMHQGGPQGVKLTRNRGSYEGSGSGRLGFECGSTPTTSAYTIEARVMEAEVINGVWRATKLEGTFRVNQSAQLGCRSGSITTAFTATQVDRN